MGNLGGNFFKFFLIFLDLPIEHQVMCHGYIHTHGTPPILCAIGNIFKKKIPPTHHPYCRRGETTYAMGWLKWGPN
jgi:hypothetical protein